MKNHEKSFFLKVDFSGIRCAVRTRAARAKNVFLVAHSWTRFFFDPFFGTQFLEPICMGPISLDPFFVDPFFDPFFLAPRNSL